MYAKLCLGKSMIMWGYAIWDILKYINIENLTK